MTFEFGYIYVKGRRGEKEGERGGGGKGEEKGERVIIGVFSKEKEKHALMAIIIEILSFLEQSFPRMEKTFFFPCPFCGFGGEGGGGGGEGWGGKGGGEEGGKTCHGFGLWEVLEGLRKGERGGEDINTSAFFSSSPSTSSSSPSSPFIQSNLSFSSLHHPHPTSPRTRTSSLSLSSPLTTPTTSPSSPFAPSSPSLLSFPHLSCGSCVFSGVEIAPELLFDHVKQLAVKDVEKQEIIGLFY